MAFKYFGLWSLIMVNQTPFLSENLSNIKDRSKRCINDDEKYDGSFNLYYMFFVMNSGFFEGMSIKSFR